MGQEDCGIVEEVGSDVTSVKPGQFVIGSFFASDNTCPNCVAGTQQSIQQAIGSARRGGYVSYGGVPHEVELDADDLFIRHTHLHGGPAPVRRYLPELIDLVRSRKIGPGKVFNVTLPLDQVAEGYRDMDERRAIKALLLP